MSTVASTGEENRGLEAALARVDAGKARAYYDAEADAKARDGYYAPLPGGEPTPDERRGVLGELLSDTHAPQPRYDPTDHVYPWVDLHPDRELRSIYSGKSFAPEELIKADVRIEQGRTQRLQQLVAERTAVGPRELEAEIHPSRRAWVLNPRGAGSVSRHAVARATNADTSASKASSFSTQVSRTAGEILSQPSARSSSRSRMRTRAAFAFSSVL